MDNVIDTPIGKKEIPSWILKENKSLTDIDLLKRFIDEEKKTKFVDPFLLDELQKRDLIKPGDKIIDTRERLDKKLENLWESLEDVPFRENKESELILDGKFLDFEPGTTTREDIWQWFDERYSKGISYLLYEYEIKDNINQEDEGEEL